MIYRPQRGGLEESMAAKVILLSSKRALAKYLGVIPEDITADLYEGTESRMPQTWVIIIDGQAVGFTNQEPT